VLYLQIDVTTSDQLNV